MKTKDGKKKYDPNFLVSGILLLIFTAAQSVAAINFPGGRIALSHDGNNYDKDDYVASAMNLALLEGTGLKDKLVHFDHSCHLKNNPRQYEKMLESVYGAVERFNIDTSKIFDVQTQLAEAIANFKTEAEKSSADNPLWFCCGGPMEVPWRCIHAVDPAKRQYIFCISHSSPFNEGHVSPPKMTHDWDDIKALGVVTIRIKNQNRTEWNTKKENVFWMRDSRNPNLQWLYNINAKGTYDTSDSGMLWWVMTGVTNGGDQNGGWEDYKPILESLEYTKPKKAAVGESYTTENYYVESDGLVVMEAENTSSDLDLWVKKTTGLESAHTGTGYIEFTGNNTSSGPLRSPLEYAFKINQSGLYTIHLYCARETVGQRKDVANDCYIRVEGNYGQGPNVGKSHGDDAPSSALQKDTKFFGGDHNTLVWATGNRLDLGGNRNKRVAVYDFVAGETYKLIVSGRSQKFKLDRIVFRHASVEADTAQNTSLPESERMASYGDHPARTRLVVMADMGCEPDEMQQMVHMLM